MNAFHTELISKLVVSGARSKVSRMDLQVLNRMVRDKEVRPIFEHVLAAARSSTSADWTMAKRHMYSEVRRELKNKLNELTTPHFQSAASLEDVTAIIVACQATYDTFVETTKAFNKAPSLHYSAPDKLARAIADIKAKLNLVGEYSHKNRVGTRAIRP